MAFFFMKRQQSFFEAVQRWCKNILWDKSFDSSGTCCGLEGKPVFHISFILKKRYLGKISFIVLNQRFVGKPVFSLLNILNQRSSQHGADVDFRCGRRMQSLIPPKFNPKQTKLLPLIGSFLLLIYEGQVKCRMMYFLRNCLRMNCLSSGRCR